MKKMNKLVISFALALVMQVSGQAQSRQQVSFMLTYDAPSQVYTAWVVPNYSTPNHHNPDSEEKGVTAQFSLKVPQGVEISQVQDLKGSWEKQPTKLGNNEYFKAAGIDTNYEYYIIGKSPLETNYGVFQADEPVALFTFKATGDKAKAEAISILENQDEFVEIAYNKLSLNVASSFYSRSGQAAQMEAQPQEQFTHRTTLTSMMQRLSEKYKDSQVLLVNGEDASNTLLAYPNPTTASVTLKYFSTEDNDATVLSLVDGTGKELSQQQLKTKVGLNTTTFDVSKHSAGSYSVVLSQPTKKLTKKIIKE